MNQMDELLTMLGRIATALERIAEDVTALSRENPRMSKTDKEAQAIVLLSQMDRPTMAAIARKLKVPRTTLQKWPNFAKAWQRAQGNVRDVRRGHRDADGGIDAED